MNAVSRIDRRLVRWQAVQSKTASEIEGTDIQVWNTGKCVYAECDKVLSRSTNNYCVKNLARHDITVDVSMSNVSSR